MIDPGVPLSGKTILVAEDDDVLREMLVMEFEMQGARVFEASDGLAAFELIFREKVDGIELLKRVKKVDYAIPLLMFITGFSDVSAADIFDLGADALLPKPFDLDDLVGTTARMLKPKVIRWGDPADCDHSKRLMRMNFDSIHAASENHRIRLGRGGLFLGMDAGIPTRGMRVALDLSFSQGELSSLQGCATVKWNRHVPEDDLPPGCGLEFEHLNEQAAQELSSLIARLRLVPYIPKS
jgi:CheY-like chemotaxis protein